MNLQLSEAAKDALTADGPILVLGGPGSGKTTGVPPVNESALF